jgi:hypothetical protein
MTDGRALHPVVFERRISFGWKQLKEATVAIAVYFHPKGMTLDQFNEVHRLLQESGKDDPSSRIHHSCFGEDGDLMVYDIWESPEAFQAFGEVLCVQMAARSDCREW